ncbi:MULTISPECIES: hypothetical protein [unclassified Glutamicibacter]|uniref:hypothetical protein n=1 Tax=unclassified Glutamicibacter TaxID=2627139 RepID=UPI003804371A
MERFVINYKLGHPAMVHRTDCPAIAHQVNGGQAGHEQVGSIEWAAQPQNRHLSIADLEASRPVRAKYYRAEYLTRMALASSEEKYERCKICVPAVEECQKLGPDPWRSLSCKALNEKHIGRLFQNIGTLLEVRIAQDGYTLIGDQDTSEDNPAETVFKYLK